MHMQAPLCDCQWGYAGDRSSKQLDATSGHQFRRSRCIATGFQLVRSRSSKDRHASTGSGTRRHAGYRQLARQCCCWQALLECGANGRSGAAARHSGAGPLRVLLLPCRACRSARVRASCLQHRYSQQRKCSGRCSWHCRGWGGIHGGCGDGDGCPAV